MDPLNFSPLIFLNFYISTINQFFSFFLNLNIILYLQSNSLLSILFLQFLFTFERINSQILIVYDLVFTNWNSKIHILDRWTPSRKNNTISVRLLLDWFIPFLYTFLRWGCIYVMVLTFVHACMQIKEGRIQIRWLFYSVTENLVKYI
jgi:hypothetical protein